MNDLSQLEKDKIQLQVKLSIHKKDKFNFLIKPLIIFPIAIFVIPFIPLKGSHKSMAEEYGAKQTILFLAVFFSVILIWAIIKKLNEYKTEKFDIEFDIERIESKIDKLSQ